MNDQEKAIADAITRIAPVIAAAIIEVVRQAAGAAVDATFDAPIEAASHWSGPDENHSIVNDIARQVEAYRTPGFKKG